MAKLFHLFGPIKWYRQRPIWPGNHLTVCPKTHASPKPILPLTQSNSAILTYFDLFHMYLYCIWSTFPGIRNSWVALSPWANGENSLLLRCTRLRGAPRPLLLGLLWLGTAPIGRLLEVHITTALRSAQSCVDWSCQNCQSCQSTATKKCEDLNYGIAMDSHG